MSFFGIAPRQSEMEEMIANKSSLAPFLLLIAIAEKEAQSRRTLKGSGKRPRSLDEVASEYSPPFYDRS
jgi:hypothetical protein